MGMKLLKALFFSGAVFVCTAYASEQSSAVSIAQQESQAQETIQLTTLLKSMPESDWLELEKHIDAFLSEDQNQIRPLLQKGSALVLSICLVAVLFSVCGVASVGRLSHLLSQLKHLIGFGAGANSPVQNVNQAKNEINNINKIKWTPCIISLILITLACIGFERINSLAFPSSLFPPRKISGNEFYNFFVNIFSMDKEELNQDLFHKSVPTKVYAQFLQTVMYNQNNFGGRLGTNIKNYAWLFYAGIAALAALCGVAWVTFYAKMQEHAESFLFDKYTRETRDIIGNFFALGILLSMSVSFSVVLAVLLDVPSWIKNAGTKFENRTISYKKIFEVAEKTPAIKNMIVRISESGQLTELQARVLYKLMLMWSQTA